MKTVLITGANKGIGFELVKIFLKHGYQTYALSRNTQQLDALAQSGETQNLKIIQQDLTAELGSILPADQQLDILINNAGILVNAPFLETTDSQWQDSLAVNVLAPAKLIRHTHVNLAKSKQAHIVNISSMGGYMGASKFPGLSAYSSSKSALVTLTECLAAEFTPQNIRCNCLCLGAVNTQMLEEAFPGYEAPVNADQMADFIYYFASQGHQFFNGKILPVALSNPD